MRIGIIGAMEIEIRQLKEHMSNGETEWISGVEYRRGSLCGTDVVIAQCGVGKVAAAMCAEAMILKYGPDFVINIGVAGGVGKDLGIGDIVIAKSVLQYDMDISAFGHPVGYISGLDTVHIGCSAQLNGQLREAAKELNDIRVHEGIVATGDMFVSSHEKAEHISESFDALAVEMEGGSIGQVCRTNGVEFTVVRAISDTGGKGAHIDFNTFMEMAAKRSYTIISKFLEYIPR